MDDEPVVMTYRGKPINSMSREELIDVINALGRQLQAAHIENMDRLKTMGAMFRRIVEK